MSIAPDVSGTCHYRMGCVALAAIARDLYSLQFLVIGHSSTSARFSSEFGILDRIAGSSLLAQAMPVRWHTLLDIAHVIYKYVICLHPPIYAPRYLFMIKHI